MEKKDGRIKQELDLWYEKTCTKDFIPSDPVQFPRRFSKREDIEIAVFLCATIAWGRRDMILRNARKMFDVTQDSPYNFVMSGGYKKLKNRNIHRTFFEDDFKYLCRGFERCYVNYDSLEKMFASAPDVWEGFALFREEMAKANRGRYSKHISNPGARDTNGSACKRLNLALRWLVRKGPVDLGLWKKIKPAALFIPLDVHVSRTARKLGLLERRLNDKKAVIALTEKLREFCPEDPVKYDYSLFGIGVEKSLSFSK